MDAEKKTSQLFNDLSRLEIIRRDEKVFMANADSWTFDTGDVGVLGMGRCYEGEKMLGIFNFTGYDKTIRIDELADGFRDLLAENVVKEPEVALPTYGFYYFKKICSLRHAAGEKGNY